MERPPAANASTCDDPVDRLVDECESQRRPTATPRSPQRIPRPSRRFPERTVARHVLRRGHTYYFRARHFLASPDAPTHICLSLRTRDHDEAKRRAARLDAVMQEFREQAVQRLVEPTMVADCLRSAVTEFAEPTLSREDADRLARMIRERCDHADEVRLARSPRLWDWGGDHVPPASMDADVMETYADEYHEALATGDLTVGLRSVSDYAAALGLSDPAPLVRRMMARVILREMAASCERSAVRYRTEVVPYLERAEPIDLVQEALDTLDRLDDPHEDEFDDREVIERTSSAPRRANDDVSEDDVPADVATGSVADVVPCEVAVEGATFVEEVAADEADARPERQDGLNSSKTVIGLWDRFGTDMSGPLGGWNADNARHSKGVARLWERVHPNSALHAIEPRHATDFQRIVVSLPSMHAKARVWRARPIREVVDPGRRDALTRLRHRLDNAPARRRPLHFVFPTLARPDEADAPAGADAGAWADRQHGEALAARDAEIEHALHPDIDLRAEFAAGELRLLADGAPVIEGIFMGDDEGPFVAAQWNAAARVFSPGGRSGTARHLVDALRRLIVTENAALRDQMIDLQSEIERLDDDIARDEATMNDRLSTLYGLIDAQRAMVEGWPLAPLRVAA